VIYPSTTPWDGAETARGIHYVVDAAPPPRQGLLSRAVWRVWGILSTYLGRRE